MEIAPNVHKIDSVTGGRPLQLYLLVGGDRTVLIDAGGSSEPENIIFPYLERLELTPSDIDMVIVTHSDHDHFGGLGAIKNANPAVALTCGDQDRFMVEDPETTYSFRYNHYAADHGIAFDDDARAAIRAAIMEDLGNAQQIDFTWSGGETLRIGPDWLLEIHHVPGHTYGHLCVFDTKNRAIFGGDGVQGSVYPSVEGGAALGPTYLYVDSYLTTIRYLIDISKTSAPTCSAWLTGPFSMAAKLIVFSTRAAPTSSKWIGRCSKLSHERQTAPPCATS